MKGKLELLFEKFGVTEHGDADLACNELRELEIDAAREHFEESCGNIVGGLTGYSDTSRFAFDYDNVAYDNAWTDACWQSYIKGRTFGVGIKKI